MLDKRSPLVCNCCNCTICALGSYSCSHFIQRREAVLRSLHCLCRCLCPFLSMNNGFGLRRAEHTMLQMNRYRTLVLQQQIKTIFNHIFLYFFSFHLFLSSFLFVRVCMQRILGHSCFFFIGCYFHNCIKVFSVNAILNTTI